MTVAVWLSVAREIQERARTTGGSLMLIIYNYL